MRDRDEFDLERADREAAAERNDRDRISGAPGSLDRLASSSAAVNGVA